MKRLKLSYILERLSEHWRAVYLHQDLPVIRQRRTVHDTRLLFAVCCCRRLPVVRYEAWQGEQGELPPPGRAPAPPHPRRTGPHDGPQVHQRTRRDRRAGSGPGGFCLHLSTLRKHCIFYTKYSCFRLLTFCGRKER